jgi:SNF2 family DNA or RNA helicase
LNAKAIHRKTKNSLPNHIQKNLPNITDVDLFINNSLDWDLIIVDEAHELGIKPSGLRWQRIYKLNPKYLLLVTATPMKRSPVDLFPMIKAIDPISVGDYNDFTHSYSEKNATLQDFQRLKALLSQVMIRHTRSDVHSFNFPRRKAIIHFVQYNSPIKNIHDFIVLMVRSSDPQRKRDGHLLYKKLSHSVGDFINWFQISSFNYPRLSYLFRKLDTKIENDPKIQALFNIIKEINANYEKYYSTNILEVDEIKSNRSPIIVFSGSNRTRDAILEVLKVHFRNKFNVEGFTSSMDGRKRQILLNKFNSGKIDILVCGSSQSRGLNLQKGNVLINLDLPNNPVEIEQRIGRVERLKQKKALVFIINIMYDTELERRRWDMYKKHLIMFQEVVGDTDLVNLFTSIDIVDEVDKLNKAIVEGIKTHKEIERSFKQLNKNIKKTNELQNKILRRESDDDLI